MKTKYLALVLIAPFAIATVSCEKKGPAERAGENLDNAVENVKDAVNPKGPVEKAGEKVDDALNQ